jgi:hypothetical protein
MSIKVGDSMYLKANFSPSQPGTGRSDYSAWLLIVPDPEEESTFRISTG